MYRTLLLLFCRPNVVMALVAVQRERLNEYDNIVKGTEFT